MDTEVAERTKELDARSDRCKMHEFQESDDENMSVLSGSTQQSRASRAQAKNAAKNKAKRAKRDTEAKNERICATCGRTDNYRSMRRYPNLNMQ